MPGDPSCRYWFPGRRQKLTTAALIVTLPFEPSQGWLDLYGQRGVDDLLSQKRLALIEADG
jgi:hypothetical protein